MIVKRLIWTIFLVLAAGAALSALTLETVDLELGFTFYNNAVLANGYKNPSILMFNPGAAVNFAFGETGWFFKPAGWFSWTIYAVYDNFGANTPVATPVDPSDPDHMKTLGLMLDAPFGYAWEIQRWTLAVQGGPSIYLRFPLFSADFGNPDVAQFWQAFYGRAQFLHFNVGVWSSVPLTPAMELSLGLRTYMPLSNIWTADVPLGQGWLVGFVAGLRFDMEPKEP